MKSQLWYNAFLVTFGIHPTTGNLEIVVVYHSIVIFSFDGDGNMTTSVRQGKDIDCIDENPGEKEIPNDPLFRIKHMEARVVYARFYMLRAMELVDAALRGEMGINLSFARMGFPYTDSNTYAFIYIYR